MANAQTIPAGKRRVGWLPLLAVLLVALIVRGGVLLALPEGLAKDTDSYRLLAETLLRHGKYAWPGFHSPTTSVPVDVPVQPVSPPRYPSVVEPTAYRPPLYPLLLSRIAGGHEVAALRIALLHLLLGLATTGLTYHVGGLWGLKSHRVTAALLVACDPILLNQSTQIMTETLAAFLAVVGLYTMTRMMKSRAPFDVALAGGAAGLAVLCRPTFLIWLVAVAALSWTIGHSWKRRLANGAALLLGSCLVLSPWVVRNHFALGRPIVATTHGGYTLALGNNESYYRHVAERKWTAAWNADELSDELNVQYLLYLMSGTRTNDTQLHRELFNDHFCYEQAFECMRDNPAVCCGACLLRIWRLWGVLPFQTDPGESRSRRWMRYAVAVWYAIVFLLAGIGCYALGRRLWRSPWLWGILLCLSFTAVHTFYWTDLRMRAPLMPFVALVAAAGLAWLMAGKGRRKALFESGLCSERATRG